jgi:hypothetical protein
MVQGPLEQLMQQSGCLRKRTTYSAKRGHYEWELDFLPALWIELDHWWPQPMQSERILSVGLLHPQQVHQRKSLWAHRTNLHMACWKIAWYPPKCVSVEQLSTDSSQQNNQVGKTAWHDRWGYRLDIHHLNNSHECVYNVSHKFLRQCASWLKYILHG